MSREWGTAARCGGCGGYHEPVAAPPAPVVLAHGPLETLPRTLARTDAPRLVAELQQTSITWALAEVGDEAVESVLVRFRHEGVEGYAAWHNGAGQGVTLVRPQLRRTTVEQLRIELGTVKLVHVLCTLPNCAQEVRAKQDGYPRVHNNRAGKKCTVARALLNSPWFVGPLPEGEAPC